MPRLSDQEVKRIRTAAEKLMERVDWYKLEKAYKALDWKWRGDSYVSHYPSASDLEAMAARLLETMVIDNPTVKRVGSGGLTWSIVDDDLHFTFAKEWSAWGFRD